MVRSLYLLTSDLPEAEELAQESMARAYERWARVGRMQSPGGYVYRTAVNLNRKRVRHLMVRARRLDRASAGHEYSQEAEASTEIAAALASLTDGQREALMLVEWLGFSSEEAGRIMGVAPASVRSRIHRARATLQRDWTEMKHD